MVFDSRQSLDRRQWLLLSASACLLGRHAWSEEPATDAATGQFEFEDARQKLREITARVLVEAQDGGVLLQGTDGRMWLVPPDRLRSRKSATVPFAPLTAAELGKQLTREFGPGFVSYSTERYALCTNASEPYAHWCLGLFERLATAFRAYWLKLGFKTVEATFPLVAIVFQQQSQFAEFATADAGPDTATAPGYFSIPSNRIVLYDLTQSGQGQPVRNSAEIEKRLEAALYNVATMVHEATHQIAFNSGLHTRLADNPLWMTEGMATYFETPDLRSKTGWNTVGKVNRPRLKRFKEFLNQRRTDDSIATLVSNDTRLVGAETAEDAYAESWALSYFLIRKQPAAYVKYLTRISSKAPLDAATSEQRLSEFQDAFGDLKLLNADFVRYVKSLR